MLKYIGKNINTILVWTLIFLGGFIVGRIVKDIPYLTLDTKVGIGDIANFVIATVVAILIPMSLSPILKNKRVIKDFLIDEVKDCINFLASIKSSVDDMSIKGSNDENDRVKINSMIAQDLGMKIGSLAEQLEVSFKNKCPELKNTLTEKYNEYWREMTGGDLMSQNFTFSLGFRALHDRNYAKLQACLKKTIHEINNF
jgi:hypothetical protein